MSLLQISEGMFTKELAERLPSFTELVQYYGPNITLILTMCIAFLIMQYAWFSKYIGAKKEEIKRLIDRETELNRRLLFFLDKRTGFKNK